MHPQGSKRRISRRTRLNRQKGRLAFEVAKDLGVANWLGDSSDCACIIREEAVTLTA